MFKLLLLIVNLAGQPVGSVEVPGSYNTKAACEADAPRAAGMMEQILDNKFEEHKFTVPAYRCEIEA